MNSEPTQADLDLEVIATLKELGGEEEPGLFLELVDLFVQDATENLAALNAALEQGDALALERTAHTLKSSCANLGAVRMSQLCFELEQLGKSRSLQGAPVLVERTREAFETVSAALAAHKG